MKDTENQTQKYRTNINGINVCKFGTTSSFLIGELARKICISNKLKVKGYCECSTSKFHTKGSNCVLDHIHEQQPFLTNFPTNNANIVELEEFQILRILSLNSGVYSIQKLLF